PLLTECRSATCSYNLSCPPQCGLSSLPPADIEDHIDDCDSRTNAEEPQQHCPSTWTTATLIRHHRRVVTRTTATLIRHYRGVVSRLHVVLIVLIRWIRGELRVHVVHVTWNLLS